MKHLKTFALAAVATGALMACVGAGTASATTLCSTTGSNCTFLQRITGHFSFSTGGFSGSFDLKETSAPGGEGKTLDECSGSEIEGEITNSGSSTETVTTKTTKLSWSSCTFPTSTTELGKDEIHKIAGTSIGTVTSDTGTKVTINTIFFGTCVYVGEAGKSIGDITEGNPAVLHLNAVTKKKEGSAFACPETAVATGTYTLASPATTVSVSDS
jgi:hypothetical protein